MPKRYIDVDEFALMLSIHCEMIAHNDYDSQVAKGYRLAYRHVIELLTNPACNNYLLVDVPDESDETAQDDTKQDVSEHGVSEQADTKQNVSEHNDTATSETGHGVSAQCDGDSCYINYD